jgi:crotonobetainyl-CoA:carnitine CoA-transferase CaiB-like acyl-CoA transferase
LVSTQTRTWDRDVLTETLLDQGVAAAPVHELDEVLSSEQLRARSLFVDVDHRYGGTHEVARTPWNLSLTPATPVSSAPLVGEHTDEVLRDLLGLADEEIAQLRENGALR